MHTFLVSLIVATSVLGTYGPRQLANGESADAYELSATTAAGLLPPTLRVFFEPNRDSFLRGALSATASSTANDRGSTDAGRHRVLLDIGAGADDSDARHEAALRFPRDRTKAKELYAKHGVDAGGWLPWVVQEQYGKLVRAFKAGEAEQIVREAGVLLHFATDAALPFNTTARSAGTTSRSPGSPEDSGASPHAPSSRLRQRFHGALVKRLRTRLDHEVRVSPQRLADVPDVLDAVFDVMVDARRAADRLVAIDRSIVAELAITDVDAFVASSDLYFARLTEAAAPILETQIETGALLGANLITAAWVEAGRPEPGAVTGSQPVKNTGTARPTAENQEAQATKTGLVGSRNSTTYHRASCSHVARIKTDNRVYFATIEEARMLGRKPCKQCRPEPP